MEDTLQVMHTLHAHMSTYVYAFTLRARTHTYVRKYVHTYVQYRSHTHVIYIEMTYRLNCHQLTG